MKFQIEQIAICPRNGARATQLLAAMGLNEWMHDIVIAHGEVHGKIGELNKAHLAFNYQATRGLGCNDAIGDKSDAQPLELELLDYKRGANWMAIHPLPAVSHIGMHCSEEDLAQWRQLFDREGILVAQDVWTQYHSNAVIRGQRWYHYVVFDTHDILGLDVKFIVRYEEQRMVAAVPLEY